MTKIRVGLFFGGVDQEREVSKKSASTVRRNLNKDTYQVVNIEILPGETFVIRGKELEFDEVCSRIDIAVLALHGLFGEDGTLQRLLDEHMVPHTGSDALASAISFSKLLTKEVFERFSIKTPAYTKATKEECPNKTACKAKAGELFMTFPQPCVVKPTSAGSSLGVSICSTAAEIAEGLHKAFQIGDKVVIEEFISGCEYTVGVIDDFRGQEIYPLPAVEIIPPVDKDFFDFETKYDGTTQEICPAVLSDKIAKELGNIASKVHKALHLKDYSRTDFIIHPTRGIFALEVNTLPGMSSESLFPKELKAVGIPMSEFLDHIITRNLN